MSAATLQASEVMDMSASLLNDTARSVFTYDAQMPYLNMALNELQEHFQLNNVSVTNQTTSNPITIPIGTKIVNSYDGVGKGLAPNYPNDLVEIRGIYERLSGTTNPFIPLTKRDFLPHSIDDLPTESLMYWIWENQQIKFIGATTAREIKLDYIKTLFPKIVDEAQMLGIINAKTFLGYRTASLCAQFIGENKTRADSLNIDATLGIDRAVGISSKGRQNIVTRRKPFMAAYKRRSFT